MLLSRLIQPVNPLPALCLLCLLLAALLWISPGRKRWLGYFCFALISLGVLCGNLLAPRPILQRSLLPDASPPREQVIAADPVQVFLSPPYSREFLGLASIRDRDGLILFKAPSDPDSKAITEGNWWKFRGVERSPQQAGLDPEFLQYLRTRGVNGIFEAVLPPEPSGIARPVAAVFSELRQRALTALARGSSPTEPSTRIYQALVLGQRLGLESGQKAVFRDTGTAHLFAISGLHVGLVGTFLMLFFRLLGIRGAVQVSTSLVVLLFYVLLTGAAPSAVRAYLMVAFLTGSKVLNRGYRPEAALAASALVVLLFDPEQLFSLGFQLSYTVVLSILVFGVPLARELIRLSDPPFIDPERPENHLRKPRVWILTSFSISLTAFLASAPISIDHFGVLPLSAILLNLLLIPPASIVLALGFLSVLAGLVGVPLIPEILNTLSRPILEAMFWVVRATDSLAVSSIPVEFAFGWMGPAALFGFLITAFWVGTRAAFRKRYLLLPSSVLLAAVLAALAF